MKTDLPGENPLAFSSEPITKGGTPPSCTSGSFVLQDRDRARPDRHLPWTEAARSSIADKRRVTVGRRLADSVVDAHGETAEYGKCRLGIAGELGIEPSALEELPVGSRF